MSGAYLDGETIDLAGRLHFQLPDVKPAAANNAADGFDLWSTDRLADAL